MSAMKRSASVLSSTAVSGDGVRTAASARAAGPRRWVRARGGCAVRARQGALVLADGGASCQAHVG